MSLRIISISSLVFTILLVGGQKNSVAKANEINIERAYIFNKRASFLAQYNTIDNPLIITSHYRGSPFIESAMVAGVLMSGSLKTTFLEDLTRMYPNTYFYYDWTEAFYFWDQFKDARDFIDINKPVYIFIGEGKEAGLNIIQHRITSTFPDHDFELTLLHRFEDPKEYFYELRFKN